MKNETLVSKVKNIPNLRRAWQVVRSSAFGSLSNKIRQEAIEYDTEIDKHLKRIQRQLRENRFTFQPSFGVAKKNKSGTKTRPIVLAPIDSRIVQRAILQVLQTLPSLKSLIETPTSCGGIQNRGVRYAVEKAYNKIMTDGKYFVRSDIKAFFTKIPKSLVLKEIEKHTTDEKFLELMTNALELTLSNADQLGQDFKLFPIYDTGVAQGSCLSPLMGNILLHEFDTEINSQDVLCLRYIDDFIIIGPNRKSIEAKLRKANKILNKLDLEIYDPSNDPEKSEHGESSNGFTFLGCDIRPGMITPTKASRKRIIKKVQEILERSKNKFHKSELSSSLGDNSFLGALSNGDLY